VVSLPASYFGPRQEDFLRLAYANVDVAAVNALPERLADGRPRMTGA